MKGRRQDGQARGRHHRRASTLNEPSPHQNPFASSKTAHERRDPKHRRARDEQAPPAEQISRTAAEQQEPAIGEQIGARDPLQALFGDVQMP